MASNAIAEDGRWSFKWNSSMVWMEDLITWRQFGAVSVRYRLTIYSVEALVHPYPIDESIRNDGIRRSDPSGTRRG